MWEFLGQLAGDQIANSLGGGLTDWKTLWEKMQKDPSVFSGNTTPEGVPTSAAASQFAAMMNRAGRAGYLPGLSNNLGFSSAIR